MNIMPVAGLFLGLAALLGYVNHRWVKLPPAIGLMVLSLLVSLLLMAGSRAGLPGTVMFQAALAGLDFRGALLDGMLSVLLFAGAIHVDLDDLRRQKWVVALLATAGVLLSTLLVGFGLYYLLPALGLPLPLLACLAFGALVSPTDPVAVLALLKSAGAPASLEIKITGESLFNDGVGLVVFLVLAGMAFGAGETPGHAATLLLQEVAGGLVLGLAMGLLAYRLLKDLDDYSVEIMITLAVVLGGSSLASALHTSGPLAVVVAGLFLGNHGRAFAMSPRTRQRLDDFWELLDEILNSVLFVWIGLELAALPFSLDAVLAGLVSIPLALLARFVAVGSIIQALRLRRGFSHGVVRILTWGGLRGGISVALAMSLPAGPARDLFLPAAYVLIVFSILVQGLTLPRLVRHLAKSVPA